MTPEDEKRVEELLDLFIQPGWKHIIEDFSETAKNLDSIAGVDTEKQLQRNKGKLEAISVLLSYEDTVRRMIDDAEAA